MDVRINVVFWFIEVECTHLNVKLFQWHKYLGCTIALVCPISGTGFKVLAIYALEAIHSVLHTWWRKLIQSLASWRSFFLISMLKYVFLSVFQSDVAQRLLLFNFFCRNYDLQYECDCWITPHHTFELRTRGHRSRSSVNTCRFQPDKIL